MFCLILAQLLVPVSVFIFVCVFLLSNSLLYRSVRAFCRPGIGRFGSSVCYHFIIILTSLDRIVNHTFSYSHFNSIPFCCSTMVLNKKERRLSQIQRARLLVNMQTAHNSLLTVSVIVLTG